MDNANIVPLDVPGEARESDQRGQAAPNPCRLRKAGTSGERRPEVEWLEVQSGNRLQHFESRGPCVGSFGRISDMHVEPGSIQVSHDQCMDKRICTGKLSGTDKKDACLLNNQLLENMRHAQDPC